MSRFETVSKIIECAKASKYQYGKNDCFFLGMTVVDALQGTSHVKTFAGSYKSLFGAQKALRKRGYISTIELLETILTPIGWGSAVIGDIAIIDEVGSEHVVVCGGGAWHSITETGPKVWALSSAKQAFKV